MDPEVLSCLLPDPPILDATPVLDAFTQPNEAFLIGTPIELVVVNGETDPLLPDLEAENEDSNEEEEEEEETQKRKSVPELWRQNLRKNNKNKGLAYVKANGEVAPGKQLGPPCKCSMKCYDRLGKENWEKVFRNFWNLGDYSLQNAYLAGCVRITLPKTSRKKAKDPEEGSRRLFTRLFYVNVNGVDTEVCKQAFLSMHRISNGRLDRLLKKKQERGNTGTDARGRHNNKSNKIPPEKIREVRKSIDSFRHWAGFTGKRKTNNVELLPAPLTIRSMYKAYRDEQLAKGQEPVCEFRYRKIFHSDFHIDFIRNSATPQTPAFSTDTLSQSAFTLPDVLVSDLTQATDFLTHQDNDSNVFTFDEGPVYATLEGPKDISTTYVSMNGQDFYPSNYTSSWVLSSEI